MFWLSPPAASAPPPLTAAAPCQVVAFAADGRKLHTHLFGRDLVYFRYVHEEAELHAALHRQRAEAGRR